MCPVGATQALRVLCYPGRGFRTGTHRAKPSASEAKGIFLSGPKDQEEKTEIFLSGPKGPNLLDSSIATEGEHSGYQSSDEMVSHRKANHS